MTVCEMQAQEQEAQHELESALSARTAAIQGLASMVGDPQDLWQAAVQLAKTYTSAAGKVPLAHYSKLATASSSSILSTAEH